MNNKTELFLYNLNNYINDDNILIWEMFLLTKDLLKISNKKEQEDLNSILEGLEFELKEDKETKQLLEEINKTLSSWKILKPFAEEEENIDVNKELKHMIETIEKDKKDFKELIEDNDLVNDDDLIETIEEFNKNKKYKNKPVLYLLYLLYRNMYDI